MPPSPDLYQMLLLGTIVADTYYQDTDSPCPIKIIGDPPEPDDEFDPHASFLRKFILQKKTTGNDAFDLLFHTKLAEKLEANKEEFSEHLNELARAWEWQHKGHHFFGI